MVVEREASQRVRPHLLPSADFVALASGRGDASVIDRLWSSEWSRRKLVVRRLLDEVERTPAYTGPLPPVAKVWSILASIHRADANALRAVLLHPQVGTGLSYGLRRLTRNEVNSRPLWVEYGQLQAIGLVGAARAGLGWNTTVPAWNGWVMLPTMGSARFLDCPQWTTVTGRTEDGRIWLTSDNETIEVGSPEDTDKARWWPSRQIDLGCGPGLSVWLEDLDPFRDLADPVPPERLTAEQAERWTGLLGEAWRIIHADQPDLANSISVGVTSIVPLPPAPDWENRSASTGEAFGSVMVSAPSDATSLAVAIVHEFQHIKLGGSLHLVTLSEDSKDPELYAPWRDDPRPLPGLIQGAYAFMGIAQFWRAHRGNVTGTAASLATFEYLLARQQLVRGLHTLMDSTALTPLGVEFVTQMSHEARSWSTAEDDLDARRLADLIGTAHQVGWRIRHLQADPSAVNEIAQAWEAGAPAPQRTVPTTLVPRLDRLNWSQGRLGLARRWIVARHRLGEALAESAWAAGMTESDVALIGGEPETAINGYRSQLSADPHDLNGWTGLGLALAAQADRPASALLLERPELVYAVHQAIGKREPATSPEALAAWLADRPS